MFSPATPVPHKAFIKNYVIYSKILGEGSMGCVKLAEKQTDSIITKYAVKIVAKSDICVGRSANGTTDHKDTPREREQRIKREMTIMQLLHHPHICRLVDWTCENKTYYLFMEYVDGGQLLDYIINHGKLKEKQARKFARQIASALDYCHQNAVVHRDLKIENILISRDENIKIIDFGLSNFYSTKTTLTTFCGSLYFAAPELLRARDYVGPEVDLWSFGVVLFVMVSGRVPFDDTSLPILHQKIKLGVIDYPEHLSKECTDLLTKILQVDPRRRESMPFILQHAWMNKGYGKKRIASHLPVRRPLDTLDALVVAQMHQFGFGLPEDIHDRLRRTIASHEYQYAMRRHQHVMVDDAGDKGSQGRPSSRSKSLRQPNWSPSSSFSSSFSSSTSPPTAATASGSTAMTKVKSLPSTSAPTMDTRSLVVFSKNGTTTPNLLSSSTINGYDPLLSVYYLVSERIARENERIVRENGGEIDEKHDIAQMSPMPSASSSRALSIASSSATSLHRSTTISFFRSAGAPRRRTEMRRSSSLMQKSKTAAKRLIGDFWHPNANNGTNASVDAAPKAESASSSPEQPLSPPQQQQQQQQQQQKSPQMTPLDDHDRPVSSVTPSNHAYNLPARTQSMRERLQQRLPSSLRRAASARHNELSSGTFDTEKSNALPIAKSMFPRRNLFRVPPATLMQHLLHVLDTMHITTTQLLVPSPYAIQCHWQQNNSTINSNNTNGSNANTLNSDTISTLSFIMIIYQVRYANGRHGIKIKEPEPQPSRLVVLYDAIMAKLDAHLLHHAHDP
ncbi:kinase-like domain-containing protein [Gongronella butleri]|nr:kinase-like domain-containing protein [Gongronella butleri]